MKRMFFVLLLLFVTAESAWSQKSGASQAIDPSIKNTSYRLGSERVLRHEVVLNAPLKAAWDAFSSADGLKTFVAPTVEFELKTEGKFHSNYKKDSTIGDPGTIYNTVLAYVPEKMLAFRIGLTERFPAEPRAAGTLFAVLEFQPVSKSKTKVSVSMLGWKDGPQWDEVYKFFDWGNAYTMDQLRKRFVSGPIDWDHVRPDTKAK